MSGTKKERVRIGFGLGRLEVGSTIAGLVVVLGIWMESREEIGWAIRHHNLLSFAVGPTLIGLGVFAEVAIAVFAARQARRTELEAANRIAELNSVVSAASQRIAELNLLAEEERTSSAALEFEVSLLLRDRSLGDIADFQQAMWAFRGTNFVTEAGDDRESRSLLVRLTHALRDSDWHSEGVPERRLNLGEGVFVWTVGKESEHDQPSEASEALAEWLNAHNVATITGVILREGLARGTLVIAVGAKPETSERFRQFQEERARQKKERIGAGSRSNQGPLSRKPTE